MFQLLLSLLVNLIYVNCETNAPIISTRYGLIQGFTGSYNLSDFNHNYQAFLGIPFAEPPVGDKRFQPPTPFNSTWTTPYQATQFGNGCVQNPSLSNDYNFNISEDCLYLNIWRPELDDSSDELLPVFYHIHGSGYVALSGSMPNSQGDVLAATQKVIVVNSNYRLGAFGFAYGSSDLMPGNAGIYDALMVLHWIQENIRSFGGDPNRVTLSGLSAGSKMVSIISSLPNTRHLYSRLIMMSGSAVNQIHIESPEVALLKTKLLALKVNCFNDSSNETINCLKQVSADDLLAAQNSKDINAIGASEITVFLPVYGTQLIAYPPMVNHRNHLQDNADVPMIFGSEQDEASLFQPVDNVSTIQDAYEFIKERVSYTLKNITQDQTKSIFNMYFDGSDPSDYLDIRSRCIQLCSDMNYNCPSLILSELFSQVNDNIFFYENVHSAEKMSRPYGTQHGDDLMLALGAPYRQYDQFTSADRKFSSIMGKVFGDFIKGVPFADWPIIKFDAKDPNSLQLIRQMSLTPKNVVYHKQKVCMEWARIYYYAISQ